MESVEDRMRVELDSDRGRPLLTPTNMSKEFPEEECEIYLATATAKRRELRQGVRLPQTPTADSSSLGKRRSLTCALTLNPTLNPTLWSALPQELLHQVFARLPLPDIIRLRVLSKTWDQLVTGKTPGFTEVICGRVNPNLIGMLGNARVNDRGFVFVRLYDSREDKWHKFDITKCHIDSKDGEVHTVHAGDAGLVCLVSTSYDKEETAVSIVVLNPLTRQWRLLPELPQDVRSVQPRMVQLTMDRESKCYKVIVVSPREVPGAYLLGVSVYSSATRQWSSPPVGEDLIFGYGYRWTDQPRPFKDIEIEAEKRDTYLHSWQSGYFVYDSAKSDLINVLLDESNPDWKLAVGGCENALVEDKAFVMQRGRFEAADLTSDLEWGVSRCVIQEYQLRAGKPYFVKRRVHRVHREFQSPPLKGYSMDLHACHGFLLLTAQNCDRCAFRHDIACLCDMSTSPGAWRAISHYRWDRIRKGGAMFELQWDAVP